MAISGIVKSGVDQSPIPFATVLKENTLASVNTNSQGRWIWDGPVNGIEAMVGDTLVITSPGGYKQKKITAQQDNVTILDKETTPATPPNGH
jgi:hypothetical protein